MQAEYRVLGSVEVLVDGAVVDVGPARQRHVLAALLADAGQVVAADELTVRVWGERVPTGARATLRTYLSRLRQALAGVENFAIDRRSGGYALTVTPGQIDLHRFREAVARSRAADDEERLEQALALWRGPAFAGMDTPWFNGLRAALDAERLEAERDRADLLRRIGDVPQQGHTTGRAPLGRALGPTVVAHRRRRGWTQEDLAERAGLSVRTVRDVENGRVRVPRLSSLRLLASAFALAGQELDQFLDCAGTPAQDDHRLVPAQLPAAPPVLVGRDTELAQLDAMLAAGGAAREVAAVHGAAGVGKTALAVHWAHRVAAEFPDGQLYVNLRGYDPSGEPVTAAEAVRGFLDALGVHPERIPPSPDALAALYRSLLGGRRMLVVLDNAADADHVRPLLPGTPTALALVTSRNQLTSLVAVEGARPLNVRLFDRTQARALLTSRLGSARVDAEPDAVDEIITRCAGLPLALTIAAARTAQSDFPLHAIAADLGTTGRRLDALDAGDSVGQVRAVFSWSYESLATAPARLFRLVSLLPAADLSAPAAASLAGVPPAQVRRLLAELTRASLLTEHTPGRYALHDLLRVYATDLATEHDRHDDRRAATRRWLDHLLHTAHRATTLLYPHQAVIEIGAPLPDVVPEEIDDCTDALAWLQAEYPALTAAVLHCEETDQLEYVWPLAWTVGHFAYQRARWDDLPALFHIAVRSTRELGDLVGLASAHRSLARAYVWLERFDDAHENFKEALRLFADVGDLVWQARTHHGLTELYEHLGDHANALEHAEQALDLYRRAADTPGQARALNAVGWCQCQLARPDEAVTACEEALRLFRQVGDRVGEAEASDSLGYAHHLAGRQDAAIVGYERSIELCREMGDRYHVAEVMTRLGDAHAAAGHPARARSAWQQAFDVLEELDHPGAERVAERLRSAEAAPDR